MKEMIGTTLVLLGIIGILALIGMAIYSVFDWVGIVAYLCICSFIGGTVILDDN